MLLGMRADRLLSLVLLLQAHAQMASSEIAERLEVSVRTVMRDVEALGVAGIPVYTERGRNGGVRLVEGYRSGLADLSRREAESLVVGQPRLARDLGLGNALDTAIEKITGAGGGALRGGIEQGRARIIIDVDPWMRSAEPVPFLARIHDGLLSARRLDIDYRDSQDLKRRVVLDPLGLVAKAGVWYLVGVPRGQAASRPAEPALFRVSRVAGCELRGERATSQEKLDLGAAWQGLRENVEVRERGLKVTVQVAPPALPMVRRLLASFIETTTEASSPPRLRLAFGAVEHAVGQLMGLGMRVEVIDPPQVRIAMQAAARELAALYTDVEVTARAVRRTARTERTRQTGGRPPPASRHR